MTDPPHGTKGHRSDRSGPRPRPGKAQAARERLMSAPQPELGLPSTGEIMRGIGRLEKSVSDVGDQIDQVGQRLGDRLGDHDKTLARHDERISTLERASQRTWERVGVWIAAVAAFLAALLPHPWK